MSRAGDPVGPPEPLDAAHDLITFDSGVPILDDWLRKRALAEEKRAGPRTYVVSVAGRVIGYYSLATGAVVPQRGPGLRRDRPDPIPVMILGYLAMDKAYRGQGLGVGMLRDAALRTQQAAAIFGIRAILLPAISEGAKRFYERCGFSESPFDPMTLMMGLADVEKLQKDR